VKGRAVLVVLAVLAGAAMTGLVGSAAAATTPIRHVFVIVLENESASTTFGASSPAPYLSQTLRAQGAYLPNYYGIGHNSNDNYIAMISGQAPNVDNQEDCQEYTDVLPGTIGADGQAEGTGCVYSASVPTIASQLTAAGFTWRDYNEDMGNTPSREAAVCGHPALNSQDGTQTATASDQYAARHDPFVYFHAIIDDTTLCDTHVVNLDELPQDLATASATANYTFITPNLCDDGHDAPCKNGAVGGLAQADGFLRTWVPQITSSPAFKADGLLIITFDEAATSDASSCCGEIAGPGSPEPGETGPGGGDVGTVLLSPCITPGTVSDTAYNHYTMLGSVENLFGLPHLGYAALPGETYFGSDIFNRACGDLATGGPSPPTATVRAPALASTASVRPRVTLHLGAGAGARTFTVQAQDLARRPATWRTLAAKTTRRSLTFSGAVGRTYGFRVSASGAAGVAGAFAATTTVIPTGVRPAGGHYSRHWTIVHRRGAWEQHAIQTATPGATFSLRYVGGAFSLIGERTARGGVLRVTLDGHRRTLRLHAGRLHRRLTLLTIPVRTGVHHVKLRTIRGLVAIEGYGIMARTG
jgi:hypothetical protein